MQKFGLIGKSLSHSFSANYFKEKFQREEIQKVSYELFPLDRIEDVIPLLTENKNLSGLNVTIPFKEKIISYCHELDQTAKEIGAVNTLKIIRNQDYVPFMLKGYNTDVTGFRESLKPFLAKEHSRALIFGTGGSSKAIAFVLRLLQIPFYFVSRQPVGEQEIAYQDLDDKVIKQFRLLINCTPVGMYPDLTEILPIPLEGITTEHLVYDLIYNPEETKLLAAAKERGALIVNGLSMLRMQAEASWHIWQTP